MAQIIDVFRSQQGAVIIKNKVNAQSFCTYRYNEQQMLSQVCAYAQTRLAFDCSLLQSMDVYKGSG